MQQLEKLSGDGLEVNEKFQLREVKKSKQKKVSLMQINGASLDMEVKFQYSEIYANLANLVLFPSHKVAM